MSLLDQKLKAQTAALQAAAQSKESAAPFASVSVHKQIQKQVIPFLEFRPRPEARFGFPLSQLCHYVLEPNPGVEDDHNPLTERLTLGFSSADVVVLGARLAGVVPMLLKNEIDWIAVTEPRYAQLNADAWVGRITVSRFDKQ